MHFSGEFFGVITALCWAVGIFPFTISTRYFSSTHVNIGRLLLGLLLLSPFIMAYESLGFKELFLQPGYQNWLWLGVSGAVGLALGDYFSFSAFREVGARNSSILSTLSPGAAIIFGNLMLAEHINGIGLFGIAVTVIGIVLISINKKDSSTKLSAIGIGHGIGAAICQGLGLVLARKAYIDNTIEIAPFHAAWIRIICGFAVLLIFTAIKRDFKGLNRNFTDPKNKRGLLFLSLGTLSGTVLGLTFAMKTVTTIDAAVAQTIFSLVPVFAIPLAYFIHKEKITLRIISGASIAIGGVLVLIWRNNLYHILFN